VRGHIDLNVIDLGEKVLKNVSDPVRLYALTGTKKRSPFRNSVASLMARRVPHVTGAYLAAGWAVVEVMEWLVDQGILGRPWVYGVVAGMLADITLVVVAASIVLHGVSVTPLMHLYAACTGARG
jgi:hypothetical protein